MMASGLDQIPLLSLHNNLVQPIRNPLINKTQKEVSNA